MYKNLWTEVHASICSITFMKEGQRVSSGSGFKVGNYLVTNNHVIQSYPATHVTVRFVNEDGYTDAVTKTFTSAEFSNMLVVGDPAYGWDYAILDLRSSEFSSLPTLSLRETDDIHIGTPVATFGFQFEQANLSIHAGVLSSKFIQAGVRYLQLDASVNYGNSGGPLILPETREVIGIVTRKATGLTKRFDELIQSFDTNIQAIRASQAIGRMTAGGVDPMQALVATQTQLQRVAIEIRRSANVGIGYAYELQEVRKNLVNL